MASSTQNPNGGFALIYQNPYLLGVASVSFHIPKKNQTLF